jgi:hypothetical protein
VLGYGNKLRSYELDQIGFCGAMSQLEEQDMVLLLVIHKVDTGDHILGEVRPLQSCRHNLPK